MGCMHFEEQRSAMDILFQTHKVLNVARALLLMHIPLSVLHIVHAAQRLRTVNVTLTRRVQVAIDVQLERGVTLKCALAPLCCASNGTAVGDAAPLAVCTASHKMRIMHFA